MTSGSSGPQPALPSWTCVYNYTSNDCSGSGCRKCWSEVNAATPKQVPSSFPARVSRDHLWITPSFFRFQEEAQRYLALPSYNKGDKGLYLDVAPLVAGTMSWKLCPAAGYPNRPGGALEHQLLLSSPVPVRDVFETIPQGSTNQPTSGGSSSRFHFDAV